MLINKSVKHKEVGQCPWNPTWWVVLLVLGMAPWIGGLLTTHEQETAAVQRIWAGHYHQGWGHIKMWFILSKESRGSSPDAAVLHCRPQKKGECPTWSICPTFPGVRLGQTPPTSRGKGDVGTAQNHKNHPALVFGANLWSLFLCLFVWWGSLGASWRLPAQTAEQALSCTEEAPFQPALHAHTKAGCLLPFMMVFFVCLIVDLISTSAIKKPTILGLSWILAAVGRGRSKEAKTPCFQEPKAPTQ